MERAYEISPARITIGLGIYEYINFTHPRRNQYDNSIFAIKSGQTDESKDVGVLSSFSEYGLAIERLMLGSYCCLHMYWHHVARASIFRVRVPSTKIAPYLACLWAVCDETRCVRIRKFRRIE